MEKIPLNRIAPIVLTAVIIITAVIVIRMLSVYPVSVTLFGYDYGFYAYAIAHTDLNSLHYFLGLSNDYGTHPFVIFNWLRLPQIPSLVTSYYALQGLSAVVLYYILSRKSKLAAVIGVTLLCFSVAQTQLHQMFLWKAVYGQLLLLTAIYLIETNRVKLVIIPTVLMFIAHTTTSVVYISSLIIYGIGQNYKNRKIISLIVLGAVLTGAIFIDHIGYAQIFNLFNSPLNPAISQGIFLSLSQYFQYSWILLLFAGYGIYYSIKNKQSGLWLTVLLVSIIWIVAHLPFYNRILQYGDLAIIYFAALACSAIKDTGRYFKLIAITILCAATVTGWWFFIQTPTPQITETEVNELQVFSIEHQNAFVLGVSAQDGPWMLANLFGNIRIAAPGLFEDAHNYDDWNSLWQSPQQPEFFKKYPTPLYIYQRSSIVFTEDWQCLNRISEHFYEYTCY